MDDKRGSDEELRRAFRELNEDAGECPSAEVLEAYAQGRLPTGQRSTVEKHLSGCGICELVVQRLRTMEAPDWKATEKKLEKGLGIAGDTKPGWRRILWNPAPAYALALAMVIWAAIGHRKPAPVPEAMPAPPVAMDVPAVLPLEPETRGAFHVTHLMGQGRSGTILLKFFLPVRTGSRYSATIVDSSGVMIAPKQDIASQDEIGNFYLTCNAHLLASGGYVLRVTESGAGNRVFEFPFSMP
jgi:hypothetical protein